MALGLSIGLSITPGKSYPGVHAYQTACYTVVSNHQPPSPPAMTQTDYYCFEVS